MLPGARPPAGLRPPAASDLEGSQRQWPPPSSSPLCDASRSTRTPVVSGRLLAPPRPQAWSPEGERRLQLWWPSVLRQGGPGTRPCSRRSPRNAPTPRSSSQGGQPREGPTLNRDSLSEGADGARSRRHVPGPDLALPFASLILPAPRAATALTPGPGFQCYSPLLRSQVMYRK